MEHEPGSAYYRAVMNLPGRVWVNTRRSKANANRSIASTSEFWAIAPMIDPCVKLIWSTVLMSLVPPDAGGHGRVMMVLSRDADAGRPQEVINLFHKWQAPDGTEMQLNLSSFYYGIGGPQNKLHLDVEDGHEEFNGRLYPKYRTYHWIVGDETILDSLTDGSAQFELNKMLDLHDIPW